jgi:UDP-GlcNAc:undecaprenyl-phosphate/decaprenyl-phosphate GlcNAc-1-phosphate transferase
MPDYNFLLPAAFVATVAFLLCLNARPLSSLLRILDVPDVRKRHRVATPLMGGLVLLFAFLPAAASSVITSSSERWLPTLLIWLASVAVMTVMGIADDRHSLSPRARLAISFTVFVLAAAVDPTFNVRVLDFEFPRWGFGLGTWWLAIIFTMICSVGLVNAVNMADGKNGLVLGLCIGWLILLVMRAPPALLPVMWLLGIALAVLLIFNLQGRLFLGDGGAYGLSCAIGMLAIMVYNSAGLNTLRAISADELVLLFAVPVLDSFRLSYKRIRQGRSPMHADRDHLHHHLQDKLGWPQGLLVYWALALGPAFALFMAVDCRNCSWISW